MNNNPSLVEYQPLSPVFIESVAEALDAAVGAYAKSDLFAGSADEWSHVLGEQLRHAQGRLVLNGTGSMRLNVPRTCTPLPLSATEPVGIGHALPSRGLVLDENDEVQSIISVYLSPDGYLDAWVVDHEPGAQGQGALDLNNVVWMSNVTFGSQAQVDVDDEWAQFISSCIAGLPVARTLVLGQAADPSRYLLDNLAEVRESNQALPDAMLPVCVVGVVTDAGPHAEPDLPDEVMEGASALLQATPGGLVLSGQGRDFALTVLLPADAQVDSARDVVECAAHDAGIGIEVVALARIDTETAKRALMGSSQSESVVNAVGAVFFVAHGMDPERLEGLATGATCAFPDLHEPCGKGFWYCAHEQYHERTLHLDMNEPKESHMANENYMDEPAEDDLEQVRVRFVDTTSGDVLFSATSRYSGPFMDWVVRHDALDRPFHRHAFYAWSGEAFLALCVMFVAESGIITDEPVAQRVLDAANRMARYAEREAMRLDHQDGPGPDEFLVDLHDLEADVFDALAAAPVEVHVEAHDLAIAEYRFREARDVQVFITETP